MDELTDADFSKMIERAQAHLSVTTAASTKALFKNPVYLDTTESICNDVLRLVYEVKELQGKLAKKVKKSKEET